MEIETKNAAITSAEIFIEDHGILTLRIELNYGGSVQSFGMYDNRENLSFFVLRILKTLNTYHWKDLEGLLIRVRSDHSKVHAIGHALEDKWFEPAKELKA
jgi:hypothetical protein